jgi:hypothetical protein
VKIHEKLGKSKAGNSKNQLGKTLIEKLPERPEGFRSGSCAIS